MLPVIGIVFVNTEIYGARPVIVAIFNSALGVDKLRPCFSFNSVPEFVLLGIAVSEKQKKPCTYNQAD